MKLFGRSAAEFRPSSCAAMFNPGDRRPTSGGRTSFVRCSTKDRIKRTQKGTGLELPHERNPRALLPLKNVIMSYDRKHSRHPTRLHGSGRPAKRAFARAQRRAARRLIHSYSPVFS